MVKGYLDEDPVQLAWTLSTSIRLLLKANPQGLNQGQRLFPDLPDECLYTGRVAWIAIWVALLLAAGALVGFLMV